MTADTRGEPSARRSTHDFMSAITSSHSPSTFVNMALVSLGNPLSRTSLTASATAAPTSSVPAGLTENAAIICPPVVPSDAPAGASGGNHSCANPDLLVGAQELVGSAVWEGRAGDVGN